MTAKDAIKRLKKEGWVEVRQAGSHKHFSHPNKGLLTVAMHGGDIPIGTYNAIAKKAGWK